MPNYRTHFADDEELFLIVVEEMVKIMPQRLADLRTALEANDLPVADRVAHTLKGNAAQFADDAAFDLARSVMQAARDGDGDAARARLPELEVAFRALQAGLEAEVQ